jgi:hypothetical protein
LSVDHGAQRASRHPHPLRTRFRTLLTRSSALAAALAIGATLQAPATAVPAESVAQAGHSKCTGWTSKTTPPRTIRVLRTKTNDPDVKGRVQTVDFRRYVETVMADEWPSYFPAETLKAAATAVKQYGWYYTMNHRSSYRTRSGACYDVKDSTIDQLFRPEIRRASASHRAAVTATWGLSVRKGGTFFLTGYRAGSRTSCGADRDGYRLYAWSAYDCGRDGKTRRQIQRLYYGSNYSEVWSGGGSGGGSATSSFRVTTDDAPLRNGPGRSYARIITLRDGLRLKVLGSDKDERGVVWHKVRTPAGRVGWVSSRLTRATG